MDYIYFTKTGGRYTIITDAKSKPQAQSSVEMEVINTKATPDMIRALL